MTTTDAQRAPDQTATENEAPGNAADEPGNAAGEDTPAATGLNDPKTIRILQIAVVAMGVILIVGIGVVIARIVYLATRTATPPAMTTSPGAPALPANSSVSAKARLALPNGAQIQNMSLSGNRLAIHFTAPTGAGIRIIDTTSGTVLGDIQITPEPPTR